MKVMRTPRGVDIAITAQCNLRCKYCFHFTSAGDVAADLPLKAWLDFFAELKEAAVIQVILSGGEAFTRKDLPDLLHGIVQNRMRFAILTNGTLITEKTASLIAATRRCDYVQVSLDASTPALHDSFRGDGQWIRAREGIARLKEHKVPVTARMTIHRENVSDLANTARLLLDELGLPEFSTNSAGYLGLCRTHPQEVQLSLAERQAAMRTLRLLHRRYPGRINASSGPLAESLLWSEMLAARRAGEKKLPGGGYLTGCQCLTNQLAVRADGVFIPCQLLSHIELGRINKDRLAEVWQNHPELLRLRQRTEIPLSNFTFCNDCAYINYCTGNCPALAYSLLQQDNHPSPDACLKRFLEAGGQVA